MTKPWMVIQRRRTGKVVDDGEFQQTSDTVRIQMPNGVAVTGHEADVLVNR